MRSMMLVLLLGGCATMSGDSASERLSRELAGRAEGAAVDCVDTAPSRSLDIVSSDTLVYRTAGAVWVNRLPSACPGLRPMDQLIIEPALSGRYCRNDRFRAHQPGSSVPGPYCRFGSFTPYRRP